MADLQTITLSRDWRCWPDELVHEVVERAAIMWEHQVEPLTAAQLEEAAELVRARMERASVTM